MPLKNNLKCEEIKSDICHYTKLAIANALYKKKEFYQTLEILKKTEADIKDNTRYSNYDPSIYSALTQMLGDTYFALKNYKQSIAYYNKALIAAHKINDVSNLIKIQKGLSANYKHIKNPEKALYHLLKADSINVEYDKVKISTEVNKDNDKFYTQG